MQEEEDQKALDDIERYGCHILHVLGEDNSPPFSYSIGIQKKSRASEIIVIGLKQELAHGVINDYNNRVLDGETFKSGQYYNEFLEGFQVKMEEVDPKHFKEYMGWALWLYQGNEFRALQLIYPNTSGRWPWEASANEWFRNWQPLLKAKTG